MLVMRANVCTLFPPGGPEVPRSRKWNLGCPEDKVAAPSERPWEMPMQISAVELSVPGLFVGGGACTFQDVHLRGVGHARRGSPHEGRPARPDPGSSAGWACVVRGRALQLGWSLLVPGRGLRGVERSSSRLEEGRALWAGPRVAGVGPAIRG